MQEETEQTDSENSEPAEPIRRFSGGEYLPIRSWKCAMIFCDRVTQDWYGDGWFCCSDEARRQLENKSVIDQTYLSVALLCKEHKKVGEDAEKRTLQNGNNG